MTVTAVLARQALRRNKASWVVITLTVVLAGSIALGCFAAARRTASAHERYLQTTATADLAYDSDPQCDGAPCTAADFAQIPGVSRVVQHTRLLSLVERPDGSLDARSNEPAPLLGLADGAGWNLDRPLVRDGRLPSVDASNEAFVNTEFADVYGLHVGDPLTLRTFTIDDVSGIMAEASGGPRTGTSVPLTVVGIGVSNPDLDGGGLVLVPEPTAHRLVAFGNLFRLELAPSADADQVANAIEQRFGFQPDSTASRTHERVQGAVRPYITALAAYGALAGLVGMVLVAQAGVRRTRADAEESALLLAVGVSRWQRRGRLAVGLTFAAVAGTVLAVFVAFVASQWSPIGPAGTFEPDRGVDFDTTVLLLGALGWIIAAASAGLAGIVFADRRSAVRRVSGDAPFARRLPLTTATALRFTRPVSTSRNGGARPAIAGVAVSVLVLTTAVTFTAGLHRLVDTPHLYGWTFDASFFLGYQGSDQDRAAAADDVVPQLEHEPSVAGVTRLASADLDVAGLPMSVTGTAGAGEAFTITDGHPPSAPDEVVLGSATASRVADGDIGSTVELSTAGDSSSTTAYRVVGRAVFPDAGGEGAWVTLEGLRRVAPDVAVSQLGVRFAPQTSDGERAAVVDRAGQTLQQHVPDPGIDGPTPPSDTDGLVGIDKLPLALGVALAVATLVTITHALVLALRARRRDLATLRTFGYSRRQVWATVLWQSTLITAAGLAIGLPLGLTLGRRLWSSWADSIGVVDSAVTPLALLALVTVGGLVAALIVALTPAHRASHVRVAEALHTE